MLLKLQFCCYLSSQSFQYNTKEQLIAVTNRTLGKRHLLQVLLQYDQSIDRSQEGNRQADSIIEKTKRLAYRFIFT
jgi:hypothetical protein